MDNAQLQPSLREFLGIDTPQAAPVQPYTPQMPSATSQPVQQAQSTQTARPSLEEFLGLNKAPTAQAQPIHPEQVSIPQTADESGLRQAASAMGFNPDLIAKSSVYNFKDALKDNSTPQGYQSGLLYSGMSRDSDLSQNLNQGVSDYAQDLGNKVASLWRSPEDQEGAKFKQALQQSNFASRQMHGQDNNPITGDYSKPLSQQIGYMGSGLATGALASGLGGAAIGATGIGAALGAGASAVGDALGIGAGVAKLGSSIASGAASGAAVGALSEPTDMTHGATTGAVIGAGLPVLGAGLKAGASGLLKAAGPVISMSPDAGEIVNTARALDLDKLVGAADLNKNLGELQGVGSHIPYIGRATGFSGTMEGKLPIAQSIPQKAADLLSKPENAHIPSGLPGDGKTVGDDLNALITANKYAYGEFDMKQFGKQLDDYIGNSEIGNTELQGANKWTLNGLKKLVDVGNQISDRATKNVYGEGNSIIPAAIAAKEIVHLILSPASAIPTAAAEVGAGRIANTALTSPTVRNFLMKLSAVKSPEVVESEITAMNNTLKSSANAGLAPQTISGSYATPRESSQNISGSYTNPTPTPPAPITPQTAPSVASARTQIFTQPTPTPTPTPTPAPTPAASPLTSAPRTQIFTQPTPSASTPAAPAKTQIFTQPQPASTSTSIATIKPKATSDAQIPVSEKPAEPEEPIIPLTDRDLKVKKDSYGVITVSTDKNPKVYARIETEDRRGNPVVHVSDIFAKNSEKNTGSTVLAKGLSQIHIGEGEDFSIVGIINEPTLEGIANGYKAKDTLLGKTGSKAINKMGFDVDKVEYTEIYRSDKPAIKFTIGSRIKK